MHYPVPHSNKTNKVDRKHYYPNVFRLGNVAVSRHAQARMDEQKISQAEFEDVLFQPDKDDIPEYESKNKVWREKNKLRIVIEKVPTPFSGACLVTTVFRVTRRSFQKKRRMNSHEEHNHFSK
jgi:hypothetical protein